MDIFNGKYYTQGSVLYKYTRGGEQKLSHNLSDLIVLYVELVW